MIALLLAAALFAPHGDDQATLGYLGQLERESLPFDWTGDVSACVAGQPAPAVQQATLDSVNYFRGLAGLDPVRLDAGASRSAQAAALMMAANGQLSHRPTAYWRCSTPEGIEGAGRSNLYLGRTAARAIRGYLEDAGPTNQAVGHRTWLLQPGLRSIGIGSTPNTNAVAVFGDGVDYDRGTQQKTPAWPPAGYVPDALATARWSLTNSSLSWATASVTVTKGDRQWQPPIINREDSLVWYMDDTEPGSYHVRVTADEPREYDVIVFKPAVRVVTRPHLAGQARVQRVIRVRSARWWPADSGTSVRWTVGRRYAGAGGSLRVKRWMVGKSVKVRVTGERAGLRPVKVVLHRGPVMP